MKRFNNSFLSAVTTHPGHINTEKTWVSIPSGKTKKSKSDEVINIYELAFKTKFFLESFARQQLGRVDVVIDLNKPLEDFFDEAEALWDEFQIELQKQENEQKS